MQFADVVSGVAKATGLQKTDVRAVLDSFATTTVDALRAGDTEVRCKGLGAFTAKIRPARQGRNPKTGEAVTIPEARVVKFKPGKDFKERLQGEPEAKTD